jgi:hypothetical protein
VCDGCKRSRALHATSRQLDALRIAAWSSRCFLKSGISNPHNERHAALISRHRSVAGKSQRVIYSEPTRYTPQRELVFRDDKLGRRLQNALQRCDRPWTCMQRESPATRFAMQRPLVAMTYDTAAWQILLTWGTTQSFEEITHEECLR